MAKKVTKAKKAAPSSTSKKTDAQMSPVIQAGIVFVLVSAILVCSYAFSLYL